MCWLTGNRLNFFLKKKITEKGRKGTGQRQRVAQVLQSGKRAEALGASFKKRALAQNKNLTSFPPVATLPRRTPGSPPPPAWRETEEGKHREKQKKQSSHLRDGRRLSNPTLSIQLVPTPQGKEEIKGGDRKSPCHPLFAYKKKQDPTYTANKGGMIPKSPLRTKSPYTQGRLTQVSPLPPTCIMKEKSTKIPKLHRCQLEHEKQRFKPLL